MVRLFEEDYVYILIRGDIDKEYQEIKTGYNLQEFKELMNEFNANKMTGEKVVLHSYNSRRGLWVVIT